MVKGVTLSGHQLESMMAILDREQQELLPSHRELLLYRLFSFTTYSAAIGALLVVLLGIVHALALIFVFACAFVILLFLSLLLLPLNIPLMRKLHRHAGLRRRLGLTRDLKAFFASRRRRGRWRNLLELDVAVLGVVMIVFFVCSAVMRPPHEPVVLLGMVMLFAPVGVLVPTLYLMRRGRERIEAVRQLQASLAPQTAREGAEQEISAVHYHKIAAIEREQIIRDRQRSLRTDSAADEASTYSVQRSRTAADVQGKLDPQTYLSVEKRVFDLMRNPLPDGHRTDPSTGLNQLQVPGTSFQISYRVDDENRRIRILDIEPSGNPDHGGQENA